MYTAVYIKYLLVTLPKMVHDLCAGRDPQDENHCSRKCLERSYFEHMPKVTGNSFPIMYH